MAKRRARGEGSVFKRIRLGKVVWVCQLVVGFDEQGRRKTRTKYAATQREALEKLEELRGQLGKGVNLADGKGRQKLGPYLDAWLETKADAKPLRPQTAELYRTVIRCHIQSSAIATRKLESLTTEDIERWQAELRRRRVGPRTRQLVHTVLRGALRDAVRGKKIPFNPASKEAIDPPSVPKRKKVKLERKHVTAVLEAAKASPFEAAVVLAALHGLRIGETLGLTWGAVDLRAGVVTIRQQLVENRRTGERVLAEVKTEAGNRDVPLSGLAVAALERLRAGVGATPLPGRLLFSDANGQPLRFSNFRRRCWNPIKSAARLPEATRFHDLRHAAASILLGAGQDVTTVAATLGHASADVTLRIYAHSQQDRMREAAERIDELYVAAR